VKHWAALGAWVASLALLVGLLDAIAASSAGPGVIWVMTRDASGPALNRLLAQDGVSLVNAWAGGRVVQLSVLSMRHASPPAGSAWATIRLAQVSMAWPACG